MTKRRDFLKKAGAASVALGGGCRNAAGSGTRGDAPGVCVGARGSGYQGQAGSVTVWAGRRPTCTLTSPVVGVAAEKVTVVVG